MFSLLASGWCAKTMGEPLFYTHTSKNDYIIFQRRVFTTVIARKMQLTVNAVAG